MKIMIADDHALFREGIALLVQQLGKVSVCEAQNSAEIECHFEQPQIPDLILLDMDMPGINNIKSIQRICDISPQTAVIVMSGNDSNYTIKACIQAGALGFIPKSSSGDVMLNAIRMVISGERYIPAKVHDVTPIAAFSDDDKAITPRQQEVWALLQEGKSNKEIAELLQLSDSTVKKHITALLRKLGVNSRAKAANKGNSIL